MPVDLQLCSCYMKDFLKNTAKLSSDANVELKDLVRPRKLQLDKTLTKYKMHKSLPVSPVSEERSFSDFVDASSRKSFSYFIDFNEKSSMEDDLKKVCDDIERFTAKSSEGDAKNEEGEGSFSSDSLEDASWGVKKPKTAPRRCVSNNEIYSCCFDDNREYEMAKSESFYLNPTIRSSQDSFPSDENLPQKSYCNSLESVLSNESDCKSAPLEALFASQRRTHYSELTNNYYENCVTNYGGSLPKNYENFYFKATSAMKHSKSLCTNEFRQKTTLKTSQTQTDLHFESPEEIVAKKTKASADFQRKLLKFESAIAQNLKKPDKGVAFFVEGKREKENVGRGTMYIPSLESKNRQYRSKFCNVLNNKPEANVEFSGKPQNNSSNKSFTLTNLNFEKNTNCNQTSSLDRHLFSNSEKVCHKPPKAVRRHSSKTRKAKQYEYIKKEDFYRDAQKFNKIHNFFEKPNENTIELSYKEKNYEKDLDVGNRHILNELYDSLDKEILSTKMDCDSLEVNLNPEFAYDSLEADSKNLWSKPVAKFHFDVELESIKILNEIQARIRKINELLDVFKLNVRAGKVRALSSMYESMSKATAPAVSRPPPVFRRRNLSLPGSVERRLGTEGE